MPSPGPLPIAMYSPSPPSPSQRTKRRQVKNACTNCQKACKKCDDARPCLRCVKYGIQEACVSSLRKERKRGVKRGPYKKRGSKDLPSMVQPDSSEIVMPQPTLNAPTAPPIIPSYLSVGLPAAFYPPHHPSKNGGPPPFCHPYFLSQLPLPHLQAPHNGQGDVDPNHSQPGSYYSAALVAQFSPGLYPQYAIPRPDLPSLPQNVHYAFFPPVNYTKQLPHNDNNHAGHGESSH